MSSPDPTSKSRRVSATARANTSQPTVLDPRASVAIISQHLIKELARTHGFLFVHVPPVREFCRRIVRHQLFEGIVLVAIVVSVAAMALEDSSARAADVDITRNRIADLVDYVTLGLFTVEFILRVLADGLMPMPKWVPAIFRPQDEDVTFTRPRRRSSVVPTATTATTTAGNRRASRARTRRRSSTGSVALPMHLTNRRRSSNPPPLAIKLVDEPTASAQLPGNTTSCSPSGSSLSASPRRRSAVVVPSSVASGEAVGPEPSSTATTAASAAPTRGHRRRRSSTGANPHRRKSIAQAFQPAGDAGGARKGRGGKRPEKVADEAVQAWEVIESAEEEARLLGELSSSNCSGYYFASKWNRLDFVVVLIGYLNLFLPPGAGGVTSLRALRALRPLRALHFFAPLGVILKSLLRATKLLLNVFVCLLFLYTLFGLVALQVYQGSLRRRCVVPQGLDALRFNTASAGYESELALFFSDPRGDAAPTNYSMYLPETFCSFGSAAKSYTCDQLNAAPLVEVNGTLTSVPVMCVDTGRNPFHGIIHFDHIGAALYSVFVASSLEGWTDVMYRLMDAEYSLPTVFMFLSLVLIVNFVGIQLFTSVLCTISLEVRVEEEADRQHMAAIKRTQRLLWAERIRILSLTRDVAKKWKNKYTVSKSKPEAGTPGTGPEPGKRRRSSVLQLADTVLIQQGLLAPEMSSLPQHRSTSGNVGGSSGSKPRAGGNTKVAPMPMAGALPQLPGRVVIGSTDSNPPGRGSSGVSANTSTSTTAANTTAVSSLVATNAFVANGRVPPSSTYPSDDSSDDAFGPAMSEDSFSDDNEEEEESGNDFIMAVQQAMQFKRQVRSAMRAEERREWLQQFAVVRCGQRCVSGGVRCANALVTHPWFERFIVICILINAVSIATEHYGMSSSHVRVLSVLEFGFAAVFFLEVAVKVTACGGFRLYASDPMNLFDVFVVLTSAPALVVPMVTGSFDAPVDGLSAVSAIRIVRLFRVFRLTRLFHKLQSMRQLLTNVFYSFSPVLNLFFFIVFALTTGAILAKNMFARPRPIDGQLPDLLNSSGFSVYEGGSSPRYHFDGFLSSILSLFIIMTGENWTDFHAYLTSLGFSVTGPVFVVGFLVLGNYVMLSLFIAVILENFEMKEDARLEQQRKVYARIQGWLYAKARSRVETEGNKAVERLRSRALSKSTAGASVPIATSALSEASHGTGDLPDTVLEEDQEEGSDDDNRPSSTPPTATATATATSTRTKTKLKPLTAVRTDSSDADSFDNVDMGALGFGDCRTKSLSPGTGQGEDADSMPVPSMTVDPFDDEPPAKRGPSKYWAAASKFAAKAATTKSGSLPIQEIGWRALQRMQSELRRLSHDVNPTHMQARAEPTVRMEGKALGCFSPRSRLRKACFAVVRSTPFQVVVMAAILSSSVALAAESPSLAGAPTFQYLDILFNVVFLLEFLIKVVALGLWRTGPSAYLRDSWNVVDFLLLLASGSATIIDLTFGSTDLGVLRAVRLGRTLRPLRVIRGNKSMRVVVTSLMSSFSAVVNVYLLAQVVTVMFAILGVSLFSGMFHSCNIPAATTKAECVGTFMDASTGLATAAVWANPTYSGLADLPSYNFDDFGNAYLTVTEVVGLEGFVEVMGSAMDATGLDKQPALNATPANSLYFVACIMIGTFFVAELYAGVIIQAYTQTDGTAFLTEAQREWAENKAILSNTRLSQRVNQEGVSAFRRFVQDVVLPCRSNDANHQCARRYHAWHRQFDTVVALLVLTNVVLLGMVHYDMSDAMAAKLDLGNLVLLGLFTVELLLKMIAKGVRGYWTNPADAFDGFIVLGGYGALLLSLAGMNVSTAAQMARLFRVGRLLRLVHRFPQLRILFNTVVKALPSMGNVTALLVLVLFFGSVVGMELFGELPVRESGPGLSRHANFKTFGSAFLLLFRALTGENVQVIMRDCQRQVPLAPVYFILFNDLGKYVFLNLYLATVLDKLSSAVRSRNRVFEADFVNFENVWLKLDSRATGAIPLRMVRTLLKRLGPPLGGPPGLQDFAAWYAGVFPSIQSIATSRGNIRYRDLLTLLPSMILHPETLHIGERLRRDVATEAAKTVLAALRIQGVYRCYAARKRLATFKTHAKQQGVMVVNQVGGGEGVGVGVAGK